jgi:hypothetical protein
MKIAVKIAIASQNRKEITGYAAGAQILNLSNAARDDRQIDIRPPMVILAAGRVIDAFIEGHPVASIDADQTAAGATDAEFVAEFICRPVLAVKL